MRRPRPLSIIYQVAGVSRQAVPSRRFGGSCADSDGRFPLYPPNQRRQQTPNNRKRAAHERNRHQRHHRGL